MRVGPRRILARTGGGAFGARTSKYGTRPFSAKVVRWTPHLGGGAIPLSRTRTRGGRRRGRDRRGVSDVIATILLLGITVTLFASIFFFVTSLPPPPAQPQNQFSSTLTYAGNQITSVKVTHLAGPVVPGAALIYVSSAAHPGNSPPPYSVSQGLGGSSTWALGQVWTENLTSYSLSIPDNLTVSIVSQNVLLYRNTLPGASPNAPPNFLSLGYTPRSPTVGQSFTIYAQIVDPNLKMTSVYVNVSQLTAGTGRPAYPMNFSASTGLWTYVVPAGLANTAGTFFVFINASDTTGQVNSAALAITITPTVGLVAVSLSTTPVLLVKGQTATLTAVVTNLAAGATNMTVTFRAGATILSNQTGALGAGASQAYTTTWTPSAVGVTLLSAGASAAGGAAASASLNETVFPSILLLAHNVPAGTVAPDNTSAWLATELTADGIPFQSAFVSCKTSLASAMFTGYSVAIVDFGATWSGGCPKGASTTDQGAITSATSTAVWVVGSNAFAATACTSYTSAFFAKIGATWASSGTCGTVANTTASAVTYTAASASGLRSDGIPSTVGINRTLAGVSTYVPYNYLPKGAVASGGGAYAKVGSSVIGTYATGSARGASLDSEPALLTATLPSGSAWGTGVAGASYTYNLIGFLGGFASSSSSGRALTDFGLAQATLVGVNHASQSSVYVGVKADGPLAGTVTVTLLVNGATALLGGAPVVATATVTGSGGYVFVTLVWQAPAAGSYSLSVSLSVAGPLDLNAANGQLGISILNQATTFS